MKKNNVKIRFHFCNDKKISFLYREILVILIYLNNFSKFLEEKKIVPKTYMFFDLESYKIVFEQ